MLVPWKKAKQGGTGASEAWNRRVDVNAWGNNVRLDLVLWLSKSDAGTCRGGGPLEEKEARMSAPAPSLKNS